MLVQYLQDAYSFSLKITEAIGIISKMMYEHTTTGTPASPLQGLGLGVGRTGLVRIYWCLSAPLKGPDSYFSLLCVALQSVHTVFHGAFRGVGILREKGGRPPLACCYIKKGSVFKYWGSFAKQVGDICVCPQVGDICVCPLSGTGGDWILCDGVPIWGTPGPVRGAPHAASHLVEGAWCPGSCAERLPPTVPQTSGGFCQVDGLCLPLLTFLKSAFHRLCLASWRSGGGGGGGGHPSSRGVLAPEALGL